MTWQDAAGGHQALGKLKVPGTLGSSLLLSDARLALLELLFTRTKRGFAFGKLGRAVVCRIDLLGSGRIRHDLGMLDFVGWRLGKGGSGLLVRARRCVLHILDSPFRHDAVGAVEAGFFDQPRSAERRVGKPWRAHKQND